MTPEGTH